MKLLGNIIGWIVSAPFLLFSLTTFFICLDATIHGNAAFMLNEKFLLKTELPSLLFLVIGILLNPVFIKRSPFGKTESQKALISIAVSFFLFASYCVVNPSIARGFAAGWNHRAERTHPNWKIPVT